MTSKFNLQRPLPYKFFNISAIIIGLNVLGFFVIRTIGAGILPLVLSELTFQNLNIWAFFTYSFISPTPWTLLGVGVLYFFIGMQLERSMGSLEFLLYHCFVIVLSGLVSTILLATTGVGGIVLGPGVLLFALLFAFAAMFPRSVLHLFFILPVPSWLLVIGYLGIYLVIGLVSGLSMNEVTIIFSFGFSLLYFIVRLGINPFQEWFRR